MTIQLFQPSTDTRELAAVSRVLDSHWIGRGAIATEFEFAWAQHIGVDPAQCLAITSATEGLFAIMQMLLSPGDEVIIPSIHFVGVANAVLAAGGVPVFCDVDKRTLNTTAEFVADRMTDKTRAVCVLHYGGYPCAIDEIGEAIRDKDIYLIEDSANSPASTYKGKACGTWGDFGVWSFDAMKIMSTGDGGMVYCANPSHTKKLKQLLYLGLDETSGLSSRKERWWEFSVNVPGRRGLMNDLTAAIGIEQLKKLPQFVIDRQAWSKMYSDILWKCGMHPPNFDPGNDGSSYYFHWLQLPTKHRDGLARYLRSKDVYVSMRYFPLHRVEFYQHDGYPLPGADYAADHTLLLPLHCGLTFEDVETVCNHIKDYFKHG